MRPVVITDLPDETLALIFASLPYEQLLRGPACVCKHWREVSFDNDIWQHFWILSNLGEVPSSSYGYHGFFPLFKEAIVCSKGFLNGRIQVTTEFTSMFGCLVPYHFALTAV